MSLTAQIEEYVGAAILAIVQEEERIATRALSLTDWEHRNALEWISEPVRLDRCAGVWPRSIACRWPPPPARTHTWP